MRLRRWSVHSRDLNEFNKVEKCEWRFFTKRRAEYWLNRVSVRLNPGGEVWVSYHGR